MSETFDLQKHIETGVERIVADTIKATLKNCCIIVCMSTA